MSGTEERERKVSGYASTETDSAPGIMENTGKTFRRK